MIMRIKPSFTPTFISRDSDPDVRCPDHSYIIRTIADRQRCPDGTPSSLRSAIPDEIDDLGLLQGRGATADDGGTVLADLSRDKVSCKVRLRDIQVKLDTKWHSMRGSSQRKCSLGLECMKVHRQFIH